MIYRKKRNNELTRYLFNILLSVSFGYKDTQNIPQAINKNVINSHPTFIVTIKVNMEAKCFKNFFIME